MKDQQTMARFPIKIAALAFGSLAGLLFHCASITGGSEVGNPSQVMVKGTAVYANSGAPAANAVVHLRARRYLSDTGSAHRAPLDGLPPHDTTTNGRGEFVFPTVDTGEYRIEINDGASNAVLLDCSASGSNGSLQLPSAALKPTAAISGSITNLQAAQSGTIYVQVYGLDRVARVDPATGAFSLKDVPEGTYTLCIVTSSADYAPQETDSVTVASGAPAALGSVILSPYGAWRFSSRVSISTSGAAIGGNVVRFPLLIRLSGNNFPFAEAAAHGEDVRFAKSNNAPLAYEIERWDAANKLAEVWVSVDTVFGNDSTQYITMFWGNSGARSESNGVTVFDTANAFAGVWHMGESPADSASVKDHTPNRYGGTPKGMDACALVDGVVGKCLSFDGVDDYIALPTITTDFTGGITVCGWMNYRKFNMWSRLIDLCENGARSNGIMIGNMGTSSDLEWNVWNADTGPGNPLDSAHYFALNTWVYVSTTYDGQTMAIYKNGSLIASRPVTYPLINVPRTTSYIGTSNWPSDGLFCGLIDELQVSRIARPPDWIRLSYENQRIGSAMVTLTK